MAITFPLSVPVAWAVISAIAVIALGSTNLIGGRSRPRGALAFGLFGIAWGLQVVFGNLVDLTAYPRTAMRLLLLFVAFLIPIPFFLVEFAAAQAATAHRAAAWSAVRIAALGLAIVNVGVLLFAPTLFLAGVRLVGGNIAADWGPLYVLMIQFPVWLAFGVALAALAHSRQVAATPRLSARAGVLLGGMLLYLGFASGRNFAWYSAANLWVGPSLQFLLFSCLFAAMSFLCIAIGAAVWRDRREARSARERRETGLLLAASFIPLGWGLVEGIVAFWFGNAIDTVGLWRLAAVAVIAYGIARLRIFDLPQRTSRLAASSVGTAGAMASGVAVYGAGSLVAASAAVPVIAGAAVFSFALVPSVRLARRMFTRPAARPTAFDPDPSYGQRIEAYRAALESSIARGSLTQDSLFLAALKDRFGISDDEERVLLYLAKSAVLVPLDGDATSAYERLRLLGEGGGGRTWLARDRIRDRLVVLKEPIGRWQTDPRVRSNVLREARMAARIHHPNVVRIEEVVENDGVPVIVMEFVERGSLADILRARGVVSWREACAIVHDVLSGLEAIHAGGVVHRDIKPSNVLITSDGVAKIADFGIAMRLRAGQTIVESGPAVAGTLAYMPPELRNGAGQADRRSDLFSCAALLHECLYGSPPEPGAVVVAQAEIPPRLASIVWKGLADDPAARPASARAMADEIAKVMGR